MAFGINQTEANTIINSRFQASASTGPATIYLNLFTATPSDTAVGTLANYTSYAQIAVTCNSTNFPNAAAGATNLATVATFPTSTGGSNTLSQAGFTNLGQTTTLYWGDLTASQVIASGNTPQFNANSTTIPFA